jgi:hypothetical protein
MLNRAVEGLGSAARLLDITGFTGGKVPFCWVERSFVAYSHFITGGKWIALIDELIPADRRVYQRHKQSVPLYYITGSLGGPLSPPMFGSPVCCLCPWLVARLFRAYAEYGYLHL